MLPRMLKKALPGGVEQFEQLAKLHG